MEARDRVGEDRAAPSDVRASWQVVHQVLPGETSSARVARRLVSRLLEESGHHDVVDTVVLLVSETVTNAVLHAGGPINVCCEVRPGRVRVEVGDRSPAVPTWRRYQLEATTGRGVGLVEQLADAWGVDPSRDGKTVWFEVVVPPPPR